MAEQQVSRLLQNMSESATIKMAQLARELTSKGHHVINLSLGEPDFDTPQFIKEAATDALAKGFTKYTPVNGLPELLKAIVHKFKRDNQLEFSEDQIVVSNGAKQSIANLSLSLLNPGDEVIVFTPYWVSYKEIIKMSGATPVFISATIETDFKVTQQQLQAAITDRTRMILFSSPCNPTGSVYTKQDFAPLVDIIKNHPDILVVADEIYEYINFSEEGHTSIANFDEIKNQCIVVNGFSKGFAMTGWRLGYIAAPKWIAKACTKIQGQFTSGANAFAQRAAADALLSSLSETKEMNKAFRKRRDMMIEKLREINGLKVNIPQGAFYIFCDISHFLGTSFEQYTIDNSADFAEYVLQTQHLAIVAGVAFGDDHCIRIAYAASEDELKEAAKRIKEAVERLS